MWVYVVCVFLHAYKQRTHISILCYLQKFELLWHNILFDATVLYPIVVKMA